MNEQPTVSIIMGVYNGESTINDAITSILSQTMTNFEFIIINDGSTDSTLEQINIHATSDKRIKLFNNDTNIGLTKSLIKGIQVAKGQYIARQDADDTSTPDRLYHQLNTIKKNKLDLVVGIAQTDSGNLIPSKLLKCFKYLSYLLLGNCIVHGTFFGTKKLFDEIGYDEEFRLAQDYRFLMECLRRGKAIGLVEKIVYKLNTCGDRLSNNTSSQLALAKYAQEKTFGKAIAYFDYINISRSFFIRSLVKLSYLAFFLIFKRKYGKLHYL